MRELSNWQKSVERLSKSFRDFEKEVQKTGSLSDPSFIEDQGEFERIRVKVKEVTMAVRNEDQKRNLQSLLPAKTEKVKYPSFSGDSGEDLTKFKEKMNECYRKNRIPQSDMVDKLRENLKGQALKRVPESVKSIDTAWQNLSEAFGSPMIVLRERLKSLAKLGNIPPDTSPDKQITWYHCADII